MPQPKWYGKSLSALCMENIVDNMEKWTALRSSEHVSCHFFHLPSHCLEYMTECLLKDYSITEDMFDLLLSPHMKVLDLSQLGTRRDANRNLRIFRLASDRCLQLTTLKIHDGYGFVFDLNRNFQVEDAFASILQRFEHLQILDLSSTIYGACCMLKLGSTCKPKIKELLVDCCPGVTDSVVEVFCNGQSSLQKLSVNGTEVTHSGIRFAIEHLPVLKELDCDDESDILKAFRRIRRETRESKKYSLTKWMWNPPDEVSYKKGSVSLMVDMCPSLVDVFLYVNDEGFTDEELLGFRKLKQLKNVEIEVPFLPSIISIRGGVIPLLQARGLTLKGLYLSVEVTSEEVYLIIQCCPNIRRLLLVIKSTVQDTPEPVVDDGIHSSLCSPKEVFPLRKLETISLSSYYSRFAIPRGLLLLLLSSPTLTDISINKCFTLDDQIIEEACARNSFKYLTRLWLYGCSNVNQKGIDFFLNEANPLSYIYLRDCGNVNLEHMKTMAQEKHWNVKWNDED
ncbi:hypothetical protein DAPPUDRAFT_318654 [Daphnia pulex]|uniref:Uncharacterized protein n=1 Tax=Daphnia pulex TaxID=6669 RepID=E9GJG8_DAPPU|nr:hypothetical protein DAPPUDRAFT_318654 [Daphnia pulex]|eukprot:EFX80500.1 hypothetical protein DAPPUDRAFT_318654 [Daphnia pulex]